MWNHQATTTTMASSSIFLAIFIFFFSISSSTAAESHNKEPNFPAAAALPTSSGYLPVAANSSSALFFTFYEAREPELQAAPDSIPLLVWLQGGPGCSSMIGNFFELGPWLVDPDRPETLRRNPNSWNRIFGLLFIDNPAGTGFSFAASPAEIPRDTTTVAAGLHFAIQHFLSSNRSYRSRPLYLTGESYAGKYVPAAGTHILRQNRHLPAGERINLVGVAIGDGLTHPSAQVATHADSAYFSGLVDDNQKTHLESLQRETLDLVAGERWREAADSRDRLLNAIKNMTGLATLYDFTKKEPYRDELLEIFLNGDGVKEALGAKKEGRWETCDAGVREAMHGDVMKSVKSLVEELVVATRVLLYQGIYDLQDGVVSTEAWLKEMEWEGLPEFMDAGRKVWEVDGGIAGYVRRWEGLAHVVVSGAGHLVPADQGRSAQRMIEDWVLERADFSPAAIAVAGADVGSL